MNWLQRTCPADAFVCRVTIQSAENLCEGLTCKVEEIDKGVCICVTSDDPAKVKQIKEKIQSCCSSGDSKSCC